MFAKWLPKYRRTVKNQAVVLYLIKIIVGSSISATSNKLKNKKENDLLIRIKNIISS